MRFYKIIALSFLVITVGLLGLVVFITARKAEIVVYAKEDVKNVQVAVKIGAARERRGVTGSVTTTRFAYAATFFPTGTKTIVGRATGEVVIYNTTATAQPLVKTTRLLSPAGALFRLAAGTVVPAGGSVSASVHADQAGALGDIAPTRFTIPGLAPDKQKVIYAESASPMQGGVRTSGVLAAEDIKAAAGSYQAKMLAAFRESVSSTLGNTPFIVGVLKAAPPPSLPAGVEVTELRIAGDNELVMATYNSAELADLLGRELWRASYSAAGQKIMGATAAPTLTFVVYDPEQESVEASAAQTVTVTLDSNADALSAHNFFGKRREEIERYLLGLDHVSSVMVKFSPSWMRTAPMSPERIRVVIKQVQ